MINHETEYPTTPPEGLTSSSSLPRLPVARLAGHDGPVQIVRFASLGKYCLTGGYDRTVRLWNPFRLDPAFIAAEDPLRQRKASSNVDGHNPYLENLPEALPIQTYASGLTHPISALATAESDSGQLLFAGSDKALVVLDMVTNRVRRRLQGHSGRINVIAACDRGEAFLSGSYDGTVCIWDGRASRDTKPIQVLKEAKDSVTDLHVVAHSGEGSTKGQTRYIRTASVDGVVRTYDMRMGILKCDDCGSPITSMAPTHDGQCLAISCLDGTIRLMELETGELLNTYHGAHKAGQYGLEVAILADDATIASGSEDGECALYDLVRANSVRSLTSSPAHRPTCSISAHPTQSAVVLTTSYDGNAIVWANNSLVWDTQLVQD